VCEGIIGQQCDPDNSTCNTHFNYDCADWVKEDRLSNGLQCVAHNKCDSTYSKNGEDYSIVCEGWLRENCNLYDDKSCNQHMNYTCGDWVQEGLSKHHLCVDTKAYTCNRPSNFNGTTYNVTCDGNIGDKCNYTGDCNSAFGYTCADWIENETSAGLFC